MKVDSKLCFFQDGMLVQEQVIQSLDLNEIDLVKEKETASEIGSIDTQEETEIDRRENEEGRDTENLNDNDNAAQIQKKKEPISGQLKGEKTFDRFLDLMEIF